MKENKLIYFLNCYFLMLDYNQSLEEIVKDYIEKESANNTKLLIDDLKYILEEDKDEDLEYILNNSDEMNISKTELKEVIKEVYSCFDGFR